MYDYLKALARDTVMAVAGGLAFMSTFMAAMTSAGLLLATVNGIAVATADVTIPKLMPLTHLARKQLSRLTHRQVVGRG